MACLKTIFIACTANNKTQQYSRRNYERLNNYAVLSKSKEFRKTTDPESADLILFVDSSEANFSDVTHSELYKKFKYKSVLFHSGDRFIPLIPGIYPCLEKSFLYKQLRSIQSGYYLRVTDNTSLDFEISINDAQFLYSFLGNPNNHPIRKKILSTNQKLGLLKDTSIQPTTQTDSLKGKNKAYHYDYLSSLKNSKFILCPRGIGVSSWRLFETMRAGRVPVIISDDWVEPAGPDWENCSIRIKESDIGNIETILIQLEGDASRLAKNARDEWVRWYSEAVVFETIAKHAFQSLAFFSSEPKPLHNLIYLKYLEPFFFKHWALAPLKKILQ